MPELAIGNGLPQSRLYRRRGLGDSRACQKHVAACQETEGGTSVPQMLRAGEEIRMFAFRHVVRCCVRPALISSVAIDARGLLGCLRRWPGIRAAPRPYAAGVPLRLPGALRSMNNPRGLSQRRIVRQYTLLPACKPFPLQPGPLLSEETADMAPPAADRCECSGSRSLDAQGFSAGRTAIYAFNCSLDRTAASRLGVVLLPELDSLLVRVVAA